LTKLSHRWVSELTHVFALLLLTADSCQRFLKSWRCVLQMADILTSHVSQHVLQIPWAPAKLEESELLQWDGFIGFQKKKKKRSMLFRAQQSGDKAEIIHLSCSGLAFLSRCDNIM
jgi:hypothetical protein